MKAASHRASIAAIIISLQLSSLVSSSASFCCGERSNSSKYRCIYPALSSRGSVKLHRSVAEVVDFPIPQRLSSRMHIFPPVSALGSVSATGVGNIGGLVPTCKCLSGATSAVPHPTVDTCEQRVSLSKGSGTKHSPVSSSAIQKKTPKDQHGQNLVGATLRRGAQDSPAIPLTSENRIRVFRQALLPLQTLPRPMPHSTSTHCVSPPCCRAKLRLLAPHPSTSPQTDSTEHFRPPAELVLASWSSLLASRGQGTVYMGQQA